MLSPAELRVLALVTVEQTGSDIAHLYRVESGDVIPHGTLYSTLRRLRARGLVTSREQRELDGRTKHFFVTPSGEEALRNSREFYIQLGRFGPEIRILEPAQGQGTERSC